METNNIIKGGKWQTLIDKGRENKKQARPLFEIHKIPAKCLKFHYKCLRNFETGPNNSINP